MISHTHLYGHISYCPSPRQICHFAHSQVCQAHSCLKSLCLSSSPNMLPPGVHWTKYLICFKYLLKFKFVTRPILPLNSIRQLASYSLSLPFSIIIYASKNTYIYIYYLPAHPIIDLFIKFIIYYLGSPLQCKLQKDRNLSIFCSQCTQVQTTVPVSIVTAQNFWKPFC